MCVWYGQVVDNEECVWYGQVVDNVNHVVTSLIFLLQRALLTRELTITPHNFLFPVLSTTEVVWFSCSHEIIGMNISIAGSRFCQQDISAHMRHTPIVCSIPATCMYLCGPHFLPHSFLMSGQLSFIICNS